MASMFIGVAERSTVGSAAIYAGVTNTFLCLTKAWDRYRSSGQNTSCSECGDVGRKGFRPRGGLCSLALLLILFGDIK